MAWELWLVYVAAVVVLSLTPGPNSLLALTHGGIHGVSKTCFTSLGSVIGFGLLIALSTMGLSAILATSENAFALVKWAGAIYLIYLGIKTWRAEPRRIVSEDEASGQLLRRRDLFATGLMVAISNPKVILFYGAFLPQFMNPGEPLFEQFLVLAGTFMVVEWLVEVALASAAQRIAPWLNQAVNARLFNRITGGIFVAAGTFLATMER